MLPIEVGLIFPLEPRLELTERGIGRVHPGHPTAPCTITACATSGLSEQGHAWASKVGEIEGVEGVVEGAENSEEDYGRGEGDHSRCDRKWA